MSQLDPLKSFTESADIDPGLDAHGESESCFIYPLAQSASKSGSVLGCSLEVGRLDDSESTVTVYLS